MEVRIIKLNVDEWWVATRKGGMEQGIGKTETEALEQLIRREQQE